MADKTTTIRVVVDAKSADRALEVLRGNFKATADVVKDTGEVVNRTMQQIETSVKGVDSSLGFLQKALKAALVIDVVETFGRQLYDINSRFQGFIATMTVVTGSVTASRREFEFITEIANKYGVSIGSLTSTYAKLAAAGKDSALTHQDLHKIFEAMAMASNVLHLSMEETRLVFYALQQMVSKGNVTMEELRRQLAEKFPGAVNLMAQSMEVGVKELEKMIKAGNLAADQALPKFAEIIMQAFGPASQYALKSLNAEVTRLHNSWFTFIQRMAEVSGLVPAVTSVVQWLTSALNDNGSSAVALGNSMGSVVKVFGDWLKELKGEDITQFFTTLSDIVKALIPVMQLITTILHGWSLIIKPIAEYISQIVQLVTSGRFWEGLSRMAAVLTPSGLAIEKWKELNVQLDKAVTSSNRVSGRIIGASATPEETKYGKSPADQLAELEKEYQMSVRNISVKMKERNAVKELADMEAYRSTLLRASKNLELPEKDRVEYLRLLVSGEKDYIAVKKEANQEMSKASTEYNKILNPAMQYIASLTKEANQMSLTRDQLQKMARDTLTAGMREQDRTRILNLMTEAQTRWNRAKDQEQLDKAQEQAVKDAQKQIEELDKAIEAQTKFNETIGLGKNGLREYEIRLLETALAYSELYYVVDENSKLSMEEYKLLGLKIDRLKELIRLKKLGDTAADNLEAIKTDTKELSKLWKDLDTYTDKFFVELIIKGKTAFQSLRADLKLFAAELLSLAMKKFIFNIVGNLIGGGTGANMISMAASAGSSTLAGQALNWGGSTIASMSGYSAFGTMADFGAGWTAANMGVPTAAMEGATWMSSAGNFMGSLGATGWGLIIIAAVAALTAIFGKDRGGRKIEGGASNFEGGEPLFGEISGGQANAQMQGLVDATTTAFKGALKDFGGTGNATFGFKLSTDPAGTAPNVVDAVVRNAAGEVLLHWVKEIGRDDKDIGPAMQEASQRALLAALQASELPKQISDIFKGMDASTATVEEMNAAFTKAKEWAFVLNQLSQTKIKGLTPEALQAWQQDGETIVQTFQRVAGAFATFDDMFMSDAQKLQVAADKVNTTFATLGIAVPETAEDFYNLVHSIDVSTEAGRTLVTTLLTVAPAFMTVSQAATNMLNSFNAAASQINPAFGQSVARSRLEAAAAAWQQGGGSGTIQQIIDYVGGGGSAADAWTYATSLGADAQRLITELYQAYAAWQGTLNTSGSGAAAALDSAGSAANNFANQTDSARQGLRKYLDGLYMNQNLSPLTPMQMLTHAQNEYNRILKLAQGGDVNAISELQGASTDLLTIARQIFGSNSGYQSIFDMIQATGGGVAGQATQAEVNNRLRETLPTGGSRIMSQADAIQIRDEVRDLITFLATGELKVSDKGVEEAINGRETTNEVSSRQGMI